MTNAKEHILNISFSLFLQKSFKEVTMKDIVEKTGLSKGAFYHYFSSKEQVFAEVISYFFTEIMQTNFDSFSTDTLKHFYTDVLADLSKKSKAHTKTVKTETDNNNYFHLLFDAIRMLPDFKEKQIQQDKKELSAWKNIIAKAKTTKEIKTSLTDEQIAKQFVYLSDGVGINLIMKGNSKNQVNELRQLWDNLYQLLEK